MAHHRSIALLQPADRLMIGIDSRAPPFVAAAAHVGRLVAPFGVAVALVAGGRLAAAVAAGPPQLEPVAAVVAAAVALLLPLVVA